MANEQELPDDRKEKEEIIRNFRLMDDTFMSKVFEDKACAELLLRIILGRDDLTVQEAVTQYELKNIQGRSAKLDIYAVDSTGAKYDVEVQRSDKRAKSIAVELWKDGTRDIEKIAKLTKLPLDEVKKLFEGKSA